MKYYVRNGVEFVTGLMWQQHIPNEKFILKNYRNNCKFDFYCKTNKLGTTYGFGRYPRDDSNNILLKLKSPISLGVFIVESIDLSVGKDVNIFICFCFEDSTNNPTYGYIFIYNGTILPEDGEFIGSLDEVKAKIKYLTKLYNGKIAYVPDDVPFYNDGAFEFETGLEIKQLLSEEDSSGTLIPASEYFIWQNPKKGKLKSLDRKKQKIWIGSGIALISLILFSVGVKQWLYPDLNIDDLSDEVVIKPTAYPAKIFITACLDNSKIFSLPLTWTLTNFKCTDKGIDVTYKSDEGKLLELEQKLGKKAKYQNGIANVHFDIKLPDTITTPESQSTDNAIDTLENAATKLNFTANINDKKFDITSSYSPIFLYDNNIINQFNLSEISMTPDTNSGFMNWKILGETNAK